VYKVINLQSAGKQKIAIIDDFEESCLLMSEVLSEKFECKYICRADLALNFVKEYKPDLVLMDFKMPHTSGVELCKIFKLDDQLKLIPVIFVSGAVTTDERIETLESGGDDFISKPFHPKELLLRVQKRIENKTETDKKAPVQIKNVFNVGNLLLNVSSRMVFVNETAVALTPKQFDILHLLIKNKNELVSRDNFMKEVWGHSDVTPRNVDSQMNYLKNKITGFNCDITAVLGHGYRLDVKN
jgi:DNA-binding response OmpR family regulator